MHSRARTLALALALTAAQLGVAGAATAACGNGEWDEEFHLSQGDSGLGGTGATGDDSGLGGTGIAGDDSGLGGTGIFGAISDLGSICVGGVWVQVPGEVEVVFENGIAIGAEILTVGQTVWLVAEEGLEGLETDQVWVLPGDLAGAEATAWLDARIQGRPDLARLSIEGPIDGWQGAGRFAVRGVPVDAPTGSDVRGRLDGAVRVRVVGPLGRDGVVRAERILVPVRPPRRPPPRPTAPPPRIDRPKVDRPVRPEPVIRPIETDRLRSTTTQ